MFSDRDSLDFIKSQGVSRPVRPLDVHGDGRRDACEAVTHQGDEGSVAQADERAGFVGV